MKPEVKYIEEAIHLLPILKHPEPEYGVAYPNLSLLAQCFYLLSGFGEAYQYSPVLRRFSQKAGKVAFDDACSVCVRRFPNGLLPVPWFEDNLPAFVVTSLAIHAHTVVVY